MAQPLKNIKTIGLTSLHEINSTYGADVSTKSKKDI